MANEITVGYITGRDLEYAVYNPAGTEVTAQTALSEEATGYYTNTVENTDIAAGDIVIIHNVTGGGDFVCGWGEYKPEISATDIEAKIDTIGTNVDLLIIEQQRVNNEYVTPQADRKPRILNL